MAWVIVETDCTACGACATVCPLGAIRFGEPEACYQIEQARCTECGACHQACDYLAVLPFETVENESWT